MSAQSQLAKNGFRSGVLGSVADLAMAAPLANGNYEVAAHTSASRIGWYFDRTPLAEKVGLVVMGAEKLSVGVTGIDFNESPISRFLGTVNPQTGTSYLLSVTNTGQMITLTNAAPITLNLPNNLPVGFNVMVVQGGGGQVTCTPAIGAAVVNSSGFSKTRSQYAVISLLVISNVGGAAAIYMLMGDGV